MGAKSGSEERALSVHSQLVFLHAVFCSVAIPLEANREQLLFQFCGFVSYIGFFVAVDIFETI